MIEQLTPRVGLLPLILELYDQRAPELRVKQAELVDAVKDAMSPFAHVQAADICARTELVSAAVAEFESAGCDAIVVLFTAYAPSLMAAGPLAATDLPLTIFNTQIFHELDRSDLRESLMRNHGMHGVQDLANVLLRRGKQHHVVTGHFSEEEPIRQMEQWLRACGLRRYLRSAKVGVVGKSFEGMGDFQFDPQELKDVFGATVEEIDQHQIAAAMREVPDDVLAAAIERDRADFVIDPQLSEDDLKVSEALSAALLGKLGDAGYCAWSHNFLDVGDGGILPTVPFLAASRSMQQGYGYAGEGDALSALGVFMAQQLCPPASFTEMFCMDPKHGGVLLSHMGEANYALADGDVHLVKKEFAFGDCDDPATPVFSFKPGEATLINLIPAPGGGFRMITARVEMQPWEVDVSLQSPQGYFKPVGGDLSAFLTEYSAYGGSHHLGIAYGDNSDKIAKLAALCGVEHVAI